MTADQEGHLYVGIGNDGIYRYNAGDADSMEVLVSGAPFIIQYTMTMSEDDSRIYVAALNQLVAVDPTDGAVTPLAVLKDANGAVGGIAVVPAAPAIPTMSEWGLVIMMFLLIATAAVVLRRRGPVGNIVAS